VSSGTNFYGTWSFNTPVCPRDDGSITFPVGADVGSAC